MLKIENLNVCSKDGKEILKNFNLDIKDGEVHVIMGPNGTGKSTLSKVIMGHFDYTLNGGTIKYNDVILNDLEVAKRAKLGIFLANQSPLEIDGVLNSEFLKTAMSDIRGVNVGLYEFIKLMDQGIKDLEMNKDMMHRSINKDFSGGERKKNEILQMKMLEPSFIILDELDSGLDVDSLKIVCDNINNYLENHKNTSVLIITHYPKILEFIKPNFVHMMKNGNIVETGDITLAKRIEKFGYNEVDGNE